MFHTDVTDNLGTLAPCFSCRTLTPSTTRSHRKVKTLAAHIRGTILHPPHLHDWMAWYMVWGVTLRSHRNVGLSHRFIHLQIRVPVMLLPCSRVSMHNEGSSQHYLPSPSHMSTMATRQQFILCLSAYTTEISIHFHENLWGLLLHKSTGHFITMFSCLQS